MAGPRVGYVRVSSFDQNLDRQLDGVELDRVFTDTVSGKDVVRPELEALLRFVREGDVVVVHSLDRLAANSMTCAGCPLSVTRDPASSGGRPPPCPNTPQLRMGSE